MNDDPISNLSFELLVNWLLLLIALRNTACLGTAVSTYNFPLLKKAVKVIFFLITS